MISFKKVVLCTLLIFCQILAAQNKINIVHENSAAEARELAEHLTRSLNRECRVIREKYFSSKEPAFYVGPTAFAQKHGLPAEVFRPDGWAYRSVGKNVILTGHPHEGTGNAVYHFLENELGVRWYTFESAFVPKSRRSDFSGLDRKGCPAFNLRGIYTPTGRLSSENKKAYRKFTRRNRLNTYTSMHRPAMVRTIAHNLYDFVPPEKYFRTHPEYFSMNEKGERYHGKNRIGGQLCFTNPAVADIAAEKLESFILADRKNLSPGQLRNVYGISQLDTTNFLCLCPPCRELKEKEGSDSALLFTFLNRIARKIAPKYPDVLISTLAYISGEKLPATIRPEKNIIVQLCDLYTRSDCYRPLTHPYNAQRKKLIEDWKNAGVRLAIWDYWNMAHGNLFFVPPRIETMIDAIPGDLRYFKQLEIEDFFTEAEVDFLGNSPNFYDLQIWLGAKLMEDPSQNEELLIADFMKNHYGPAEKPMTEFLNLVRQAIKKEKAPLYYVVNPVREYQTPAFLNRCYSILKNALKMTAPGSPYRLRVEKEMIAPLAVMLLNGKTQVPKKQLADEYFRCRNGQIKAYASPKDIPVLTKELDKELDRLTLQLDIPEKFKHISSDKIRQFAWPVFGKVTDDPDSPLGKAMSSPDDEGADKKHVLKKQAGKNYPTSFGVYDHEKRRGISIHITDIPQDEKYHWYKIGKFDFGKQSFLWSWFWRRQANLRNVWTNVDGVEKFNEWVVWISVKITGPAYVKNSKKPNAVMLDRIVLVKEDAVRKRSEHAKIPQVFYSENASETEKYAATEIAGYLSKISGSRISCTVEQSGKPHPSGIFVGRTAFASVKGVDVSRFDQEEWMIRRYPEGIVIAGGVPRGTLYGAYEFLERFFGIMWLDETFTHIPPQKKITLPEKINLRSKPHFRYRGMYTWYGKKRWESMAFRSRNRENIFLGIKLEPHIQKKIGHYPVLGRPATINTLYHYIKYWSETGMEQGYSLNRVGKRVRPKDVFGPGQVCFSSSFAREKFAEQMLDFIRRDRRDDPENYPRLYNLSVNDIKDICHCSECRERLKKYGAESGGMLEFVNFVAEKVGKVYPDIRVQTSAYLNYEPAPVRGIAPRENVTVRLSPSRWGTGFDTMRSLKEPSNSRTFESLQKWSSLGSVQIWNYWVLFGKNPDVNACLVNVEAIRDNLQIYSQLGADYVFSECEYPITTTFHAMRVWVGYKLKLDPFQDVDKLIDTFMSGYYGKAAGAMRAYYDYLVKRQKESPMLDTRSVLERSYLDKAFFLQSGKFICQALRETADSPEHRAHVLNERLPLDIARLICCADIPESKESSGDIHSRLQKDWRFFIKRYIPEKHTQKALAQMNSFLKEYAPIKLKKARYPVPAEVRGKDVLEICPEDFNSFGTHIYGVKLFDDPAAATGKALGYANSDRFPQKAEFFKKQFTCGIHDRQNKKVLLKGKIPLKKMYQDEKYHFYDLGEVILAPSSLLWLHHSWYLQQNLGHLYRSGDPYGNRWKVYVSLKFTGPAYVKGSKKQNGFYMDRILLVREKLPQAALRKNSGAGR